MYAKKDIMQANKYVLDCNIYVSSIISGKLAILAEYILYNDIFVLFCNELETELREVLQRPHLHKYLTNAIDDYIQTINAITQKGQIRKKYVGSPDAKDDYLFALCLSYNATLVTGDKKLQRFAESPIPVISTSSFKLIFKVG
jgi:putative PIN family toxin of toxin-antitoxin system